MEWKEKLEKLVEIVAIDEKSQKKTNKMNTRLLNEFCEVWGME